MYLYLILFLISNIMHTLVGLHAFLGEAGALAFLWVFVEVLNASGPSVKRAFRVASVGVVLLILAWIVGGWHYLTDYATAVKPVIKAGPTPWAHIVITETKEHIFLFIPFLAFFVWGLLHRYRDELMTNADARKAVLAISLLVVLLAFAMAGMGVLISSGFRAALESKLL